MSPARPFRIQVVNHTDSEFFNAIGKIPAAQHFSFSNSRVIYLAGVFYIIYRSEKDEKEHTEIGFDVLFKNWVVETNALLIL